MTRNIYIKCPVCGAENNVDNITCDSCGAMIDDKSVKDLKDNSPKRTTPEKKSNKKAKQKKNKKSDSGSGKAGAKVISKSKLFYFVLALAVLGLINLFSAGVFDQPDYVAPTSQGNFNNQLQGADLSGLQEMNNLEASIKNNPGDFKSLLKLAHLKNDSGFFDDAIKNYKDYLKLRPNEPDVIVDMGVCYYQLNDYNNAIATMKSALQINPKHQIAHFNIGIVNFAAENKQEAVTWWKKAVELDPNTNIAKKAKELINSHQ